MRLSIKVLAGATLLATLAMAAPAGATTAGITTTNQLVVRGGPGQVNDLDVRWDAAFTLDPNPIVFVTVTDIVPVTPGPSCTQATDVNGVSNPNSVTCSQPASALVDLGDLDDDLTLNQTFDPDYSGNVPGTVTVADGPGNDLVESGYVSVAATDRTLVNAGPGNDRYELPPTSNTVFGTGGGDDDIFGGARIDRLSGGIGNDDLYGSGGNDNLYGLSGNDRLYGGSGDDYISGGFGNDLLFGSLGNDRLYPGPGFDKAYGGLGIDRINGFIDDYQAG